MMVADIYGPVKVVQNIEASEPKAPAPERIRYPRVQIVEIYRRHIISDYRWTYCVIVVVELSGRKSVVFVLACGYYSILLLRPDVDGKLCCDSIKPHQGFRPAERDPACISGSTNSFPQFADKVGSRRVVGNPAVSRHDAPFAQQVFRLRLAYGLGQAQRRRQFQRKGPFTDQGLLYGRSAFCSLRVFG
jgi:hypothetical protein